LEIVWPVNFGGTCFKIGNFAMNPSFPQAKSVGNPPSDSPLEKRNKGGCFSMIFYELQPGQVYGPQSLNDLMAIQRGLLRVARQMEKTIFSSASAV